ncbi:MAG: hypothetical protein AAGC55_29975, partial [Myxococcota bacterium]
VGDAMISGYSASHFSLLGPDMMEFEDIEVEITGDFEVYVRPNSARNSKLFEILNPPQIFPTPDPSERVYPDLTRHGAEQGFTLAPWEHYALILMADMGGQYYSRENIPDYDE